MNTLHKSLTTLSDSDAGLFLAVETLYNSVKSLSKSVDILSESVKDLFHSANTLFNSVNTLWHDKILTNTHYALIALNKTLWYNGKEKKQFGSM
ncbi:hypothetical protein [Carboxylicivirga sp. N1Y90]|uniref:hypothetical protein n=1 Tax=Carboxylicivirga fragile TaxID=3417571 RepID=UPI003D32E31A|nr:hypothetical protein [Marinilabiliaceae bacterium N1Y90]